MNRIHPTAVIGPGVELGDGNTIGPHVVLLGPCTVGDRNWIGPGTVIGTPPEHRDHRQDVAWEGELGGAGVSIGDDSVLRDHVTLHQGTERTTSVGSRCFVMSKGHVGHDVVLGDGVTTAAGMSLAGHCTIWDLATVGMGALVHQRTAVGPGAMVGMGAVVRRAVPPFTTVAGDPARVAGVNAVALRKLGVPEEAVASFGRLLRGDDADWPPGHEAVLELVRRWTAEVVEAQV